MCVTWPPAYVFYGHLSPLSSRSFKLNWHCGDYHWISIFRHVHGCFNSRKKLYAFKCTREKERHFHASWFFFFCLPLGEWNFHYVLFVFLHLCFFSAVLSLNIACWCVQNYLVASEWTTCRFRLIVKWISNWKSLCKVMGCRN